MRLLSSDDLVIAMATRSNSLDAAQSRARGCLLGQLAGDNLGALVEFRPAAHIAKAYPDGGPRELKDGGMWNILAGQPTDDSEMALALARSIVAKGGWDEATVVDAYLTWGDSKPFDMGGTTRAALTTLARGGRPKGGRNASQANGALMRASPIGIAYAGNMPAAALVAREDARLTHASPICVAANAAFCAAIATGIAGGDRRAMLQAATIGAHGVPAVGDRLVLAQAGERPLNYQDQMGWVLTAFQNAFSWLASGASLERAVVGTVRLGGDTDTNAAIVGALLGAADGEEAIPAQWREAILACRPEPDSLRPRPATYWPNDAIELADQLLAGATVGEVF